jgi:hydrogenase maturation protein HypF
MILLLHRQYPDMPLVLSGGVFQNRVLLGLILKKIPEAIISETIVPNDGGISLGQVVAYSQRD